MDTLENVLSAMSAHAVSKLFFKRLGKNNNSKNQFYLAGGFGVLQDIPAGEFSSSAGTSQKPGGRGAAILKAPLDLRWMDDAGNLAPAPNAQMILYPQYPEVRLSGLLEDCPSAPSFLADKTEGRFLILGVSGRMVVACACDVGSSLAEDLEQGLAEQRWPGRKGALVEVPMPETEAETAKSALKSKLQEIAERGWIPSQRRARDGSVIPYSAINGAGYTLESLFEIRPNGTPLPDYLGWELKASTTTEGRWPRLNDGAAITLMTPEPTCGLYCDDPAQFCLRYCLPDKGSATTRHFRQPFDAVGLRLLVKQLNGDDDGIYLVDSEQAIAAGWSFASLLNHWIRKHGHAVYVPCLHKTEDGRRLYRYSSLVRMGEHTTFQRLLDGFASGAVYYDPGAKFELRDGTWRKAHPRSQFRVKARDIHQLYTSCSDVDVSK